MTATVDTSFCQSRCTSNHHKFCFHLKAVFVLVVAEFLYSASSSTILYVIPFVRCCSCWDAVCVFVTLVLPWSYTPLLCQLSYFQTLLFRSLLFLTKELYSFFPSFQPFSWDPEKHSPAQHPRMYKLPYFLSMGKRGGQWEVRHPKPLKTHWHLFPVPAMSMDTSKPEVMSSAQQGSTVWMVKAHLKVQFITSSDPC